MSTNRNTQRNHLINSYLNQLDENNHHIQQFTQLLSTQEQTLSRLLFENNSQINQPQFSNTPLFYNTRVSQPTHTPRTQNPALNQLNTQLLNMFRYPRTVQRAQPNIPLANFDNILDSFFDPIVVAPTQDQINRSTSTHIFSEIERPQNNTCPISLTQFQPEHEVMKVLYCSHLFIKTELEHWFQHNSRCPLCRYDIRNYNPNNLPTPNTN